MVRKVGCVGHIQKRMGGRLREKERQEIGRWEDNWLA